MKRAMILMTLLSGLMIANEVKAQGVPYNEFQSYWDKSYDTGTAHPYEITKATWEFYVSGLLEGISWTNALLATLSPPIRLYCPPEKLAVTENQAVDIMNRFTKHNPDFETRPTGMVLLYALIDTFPCDK